MEWNLRKIPSMIGFLSFPFRLLKYIPFLKSDTWFEGGSTERSIPVFYGNFERDNTRG